MSENRKPSKFAAIKQHFENLAGRKPKDDGSGFPKRAKSTGNIKPILLGTAGGLASSSGDRSSGVFEDNGQARSEPNLHTQRKAASLGRKTKLRMVGKKNNEEARNDGEAKMMTRTPTSPAFPVRKTSRPPLPPPPSNNNNNNNNFGIEPKGETRSMANARVRSLTEAMVHPVTDLDQLMVPNKPLPVPPQRAASRQQLGLNTSASLELIRARAPTSVELYAPRSEDLFANTPTAVQPAAIPKEQESVMQQGQATGLHTSGGNVALAQRTNGTKDENSALPSGNTATVTDTENEDAMPRGPIVLKARRRRPSQPVNNNSSDQTTTTDARGNNEGSTIGSEICVPIVQMAMVRESVEVIERVEELDVSAEDEEKEGSRLWREKEMTFRGIDEGELEERKQRQWEVVADRSEERIDQGENSFIGHDPRNDTGGGSETGSSVDTIREEDGYIEYQLEGETIDKRMEIGPSGVASPQQSYLTDEIDANKTDEEDEGDDGWANEANHEESHDSDNEAEVAKMARPAMPFLPIGESNGEFETNVFEEEYLDVDEEILFSPREAMRKKMKAKELMRSVGGRDAMTMSFGEGIDGRDRGNSLTLPSGCEPTKYNYHLYREGTPFTFPPPSESLLSSTSAEVSTAVPVPANTDDDVPEALMIEEDPVTIEEPEDGMLAPMFDEDYERTKREFAAMCNSDYTPISFSRGTLRKPSDYSDGERICDFASIVRRIGSPNGVLCISLVNVTLLKKELRVLPKLLSSYKQCEALELSGLGLVRIEELALPSLRYLDLRSNRIATGKAFATALRRSPDLQVCFVAGNTAAEKEHIREKIIAACPMVLSIDDVKVEVEERIAAISASGSSKQKKSLAFMRWDWTFSAQPFVYQMLYWQPESFVDLALPASKLEMFHVGTLVNLTRLDLSRNMITSLASSGLCNCERLEEIDISANRITKESALDILAFVPSLRKLWLQNNKDEKGKELLPSVYRPYVIYITRDLRGTNRAPGLRQLDGVPISIEERTDAVAKRSRGKGKDPDPRVFKWTLYLIDYYGHKQLNDEKYTSTVKHLLLPSCTLTYVCLDRFASLEILDLSGNNLVRLDGLDKLTKLRFLNLSGNVKLDLDHTLAQLRTSHHLEQVSFCMVHKSHRHHPAKRKYRMAVLCALLFENERLEWVDNLRITLEERVETFARVVVQSRRHIRIDEYRFHLALLADILPREKREYHHQKVSIGAQYKPYEVVRLAALNDFKLISNACDFRAFSRLEELNLSNNKITELYPLSLHLIPTLRVLDLSSNMVKLPIKKLAAYFDQFPVLECLCIRGNPVTEKMEDARIRLIGLMRKMREVTCTLRVIDWEISIDERITCWKKAGGSNEECEMLRYNAIMFQRIPPNIDRAQLTSLDLNEAGFEQVDVHIFVNLETLLLKGNRLKTLKGTGISNLARLRVLDLRHNWLSNMEEVTDLIHTHKLPLLTSLGVEGNKFTERKGWKMKFLSLIPELHEQYVSLQILDEKEIHASEIFEAWCLTRRKTARSSTIADLQNPMFQIILLRQMPPGSKEADLTSLDLSNANLSVADLAKFVNLKKLSIANNLFTSLDGIGIQSMTQLRALNLSGNKLADLSAVCNLLEKISTLEHLALVGNECMPNDGPEARRALLTKLFRARRPLEYNLITLNFNPLTVQEQCSACPGDSVKIETIRMELCIREILEPEMDPQAIMILDLSSFGFNLIVPGGLDRFENIVSLNLGDNQLRELTAEAMAGLPFLAELDLRGNRLPSLQHVIDAVIVLPSLLDLFIQDSTEGEETRDPREYSKEVFKILQSLDTLDGLRNPFGKLTTISASTIRRGARQSASISEIRSASMIRGGGGRSYSRIGARVQDDSSEVRSGSRRLVRMASMRLHHQKPILHRPSAADQQPPSENGVDGSDGLAGKAENGEEIRGDEGHAISPLSSSQLVAIPLSISTS